jgi:hypothetical protein
MAACYRRAAASSASCWIRSTWRIAVQLINKQLRSPGADQALTGPAIGQELGVGTDLREGMAGAADDGTRQERAAARRHPTLPRRWSRLSGRFSG